MRSSADALVAAHAARHHDVVSHAEAVARGLSPRQIGHRVESGRWQRLHVGVYFLGVGRPGFLSRCRAALLAIGDDALLSHWTAAVLWSLIAQAGPRIHVVTPRRLEDRDGLRVHTTRRPARPAVRRGLRVTPLDRTLQDLADDGISPADLEPLIRSAERLHGLDRATVPRVRGRRAVRDGAFARGELVQVLLRLVQDAGLQAPETEYPLLGYEIDAAWPAIRLAVEVDDYATHDNRDAMDADRARDRRLIVAGWTPLRLTHAAMTDGAAAVVEDLVALGVQPSARSRAR